MKKFPNWISTGLKSFDLLSTSQFLRYKGQSEFTTATGGFVSLILMVITTILLYNMGILTINRQLINSSISSEIDADPTPIQFKTNLQNKFMFAIGIALVNLNDPAIKYFDISLKQYNYGPGHALLNVTNIPLQQCTEQHISFN